MTKSHRHFVIGADHAGVALKQTLKEHLTTQGIEVTDIGTGSSDSVDYPDYGRKVAEGVAKGQYTEGILICGTGIGMAMTANKVSGIRAAVAATPFMAEMGRAHNDPNILCLGARVITTEVAIEIIDTWLRTSFDGGRHIPRVKKINALIKIRRAKKMKQPLRQSDPQLYEIIQREIKRLENNLEMIPSENFCSFAVLEALGSVLTTKYAEGYPGKRYYGGCEYVDQAEELAIERAKQIFGAGYANVQPHSGSQANMAVYFSVLEPGDKILSMNLAHGGHLTHGSPVNFSGRFFEIIPYGVRRDNGFLDYDEIEKLAKEHKPKLIVSGASAYPRDIDFARFRKIANSVGALLMADIAHPAGLIATKMHSDPMPHCHFVTTTTHKTLRGPRGGMILSHEPHAKKLNSHIFPGIQGGPMMHVIAAKAVAFGEVLQPEFQNYAMQIVSNTKTLAARLQEYGYQLCSGGTDTHLILVDLHNKNLTGKQAEKALDQAGITVNKNMVPFDDKSPFVTSGIRLGTPALTTRGMKENEMKLIAGWIDEVLSDVENRSLQNGVRGKINEFCQNFPLYADFIDK